MARKRKKRFPFIGVFILVFATVWLLRETEIVESHIPWIPIILIVLGVGLILNRIT